MSWNLTATMSGPLAKTGLSMLSAISPYSTLPAEVCVDDTDQLRDPSWPSSILSAQIHGRAYWQDREQQIGYRPKSDLVVFSIPNGFATLDEALAIIEPMPFEVCILGAVFFDEWIKADYQRWGIGRSHIDHGWACAFRGAGHDRLVSRRWLDFGPWRVIRRSNDTTFIQFHDLAIADQAEAYEQAKAGHERMGNSKIGGYIAWYLDALIRSAGKGLYTEATKLLEVVVPPGGVIDQGAMLGNAGLRLHHRLTRPSKDPIERIAYIFLDEADARAHLHELWLRELECWLVDGSGKRRLDLDYHPTPSPPEWVKRLEGL
jgi:hypothetical protein